MPREIDWSQVTAEGLGFDPALAQAAVDAERGAAVAVDPLAGLDPETARQVAALAGASPEQMAAVEENIVAQGPTQAERDTATALMWGRQGQAAGAPPGQPAGHVPPEAPFSGPRPGDPTQTAPPTTPDMFGPPGLQPGNQYVMAPSDDPTAQTAMGDGETPGLAQALQLLTGAGADLPDMPATPDYSQAYQGIQEATAAEGEARARGALQQAQNLQDESERQRAMQETLQRSERRRQEELKTARDEAIENPLEKWSTGKTIGAAIAVALGSFGSAMTGTGNSALSIITQGIEREIGLRRDRLSSMERGAAQERTSESAWRVSMYEQAQNRIKAAAERSNSEIYRTNAARLSAGLELQKQQAEQGHLRDVYTMEMDQAKLKSAREIGIASIMARAATTGGKESREALKRVVIDPVTRQPIGFAPDVKTAGALRDRLTDAADIKADIRRLIELRKKYGTEFWNRTAVSEADKLVNGVRGKMKSFRELGAALTETEMPMLQIPEDVLAIGLTGPMIAGLNETIRGIEQSEKFLLGGAGISRPASAAAVNFTPVK